MTTPAGPREEAARRFGRAAARALQRADRRFTPDKPGFAALEAEIKHHDGVDPIRANTWKSYLTGTTVGRFNFMLAVGHLAPDEVRDLLPYFTAALAPVRRTPATAQLKELTDQLAVVSQQCRRCQTRVASPPGHHGDGALGTGPDAATSPLRHGASQTADASVSGSDAAATSERGALFIVLGVSGLDVRSCLERVSPERGGRQRKIFKLEDYISTGSAATYFHNLGLGQQHDQIDLTLIFLLPEALLRRLWQEALTAALDDVRMALADGDVFFVMHAVWRNTEVRRYASYVDLRQLSHAVHEVLRPSRVRTIMLDDDVYDLAVRLRRVGHLYYETDPLAASLRMLVHWRRHEAIAADHIANIVGSPATNEPALFFAVKQPVATFERLLTRPTAEIIYISYAVGQPFKLNDFTETQARVEFFNSVARHLRETQKVTVIEAASIDEFRIPKDQEYEPAAALRTRWWPSAPQEELLAEPLRDTELDFTKRPFELYPDNEPAEVKRLREGLFQTVHARGRRLATQAEGGTVSLRPFTRDDGKVSEGMQIVAKLNSDLRQVRHVVEQPRRRRTLVYHPRNDDPRRLLRVCVLACHSVLTSPPAEPFVTGWTSKADDALHKLLCQREDSARLVTQWSTPGADPNVTGNTLFELAEATQEATFSVARSANTRLKLQSLKLALGTAVTNALMEEADADDNEEVASGGLRAPSEASLKAFKGARWARANRASASALVREDIEKWLKDGS